MSAPRAANSARYFSGSTIIRCRSSGSRVRLRMASRIGNPIVMFGTKRPSITSMWIWSAPAASTRAISSARMPKSADRIEGAILITPLLYRKRRQSPAEADGREAVGAVVVRQAAHEARRVGRDRRPGGRVDREGRDEWPGTRARPRRSPPARASRSRRRAGRPAAPAWPPPPGCRAGAGRRRRRRPAAVATSPRDCGAARPGWCTARPPARRRRSPAQRGASVSTGPSMASAIVTPSRAAASLTRASRPGWGSKASTRPRSPMSWARCVVFVPGAAQTSAIVVPAAGSSSRAMSIEASSCTTQAPSTKARQRPGSPPPSTTRPSGASVGGPRLGGFLRAQARGQRLPGHPERVGAHGERRPSVQRPHQRLGVGLAVAGHPPRGRSTWETSSAWPGPPAHRGAAAARARRRRGGRRRAVPR